jgi:nitrogen-specific signal transduction histidine kinase
MTGVQVVQAAERRTPDDPVLRARDEKLESLRAVAGKLAHDFNNFLVPQFGYVTLLQEELPATSGGAEYLRAMESATRRSESYIDSILLTMRPERQFAVADFAIDAVLNELLDNWPGESSPGTLLEVSREIESFTLNGDEKHWRNAITQLLTNARYALATGGKLDVGLKRQLLSSSEIQRLGINHNLVYALTVSDNGFGMPSSIAQRAFEPFFTTRKQVKAAGLGLTLVHSVAHLHGGQVELATSEDKGTTVTVWIPANTSFAGRYTNTLPSSFAAGGKKKKVLLIEDDPLVKEVIRDWLGRMSLDVQIASNAEEAQAFLDREQSSVALVIIETDLKSGKGEDVYARLSNITKGEKTVPWIFLAGRRKPDITESHGDGKPAPMVMQKPVTLRAFAEVIRRYTPR